MPLNNVERHTHNGSDSPKINFDDLQNVSSTLRSLDDSAPQSAITSPSGGVTIDSQARTAIDAIITALENLNLVEEN